MRLALIEGDSRIVLGDDALYTIPAGWEYVVVSTPLVDPGNGLSSSPEAIDGVLCVWGNLSGLSTVTVNANLSFTFTETVEDSGGTFEYYFIDPTTGDTGSVGTLTIPSVAGSDTTPDSFDFTDIDNAALGSDITSNIVAITGIDTDTTISVTNCSYSIDGGVFTTEVGTVAPNSFIRLQAESSSEYETEVSCSVAIGGVTDTWSVTTIGESTSTKKQFQLRDGLFKSLKQSFKLALKLKL